MSKFSGIDIGADRVKREAPMNGGMDKHAHNNDDQQANAASASVGAVLIAIKLGEQPALFRNELVEMNYSEIEFTRRDEFYEIMSGARLNFVLFGESADVEWAKDTELQYHEAAHFVDVRKLNTACYKQMIGVSFFDRHFYPAIGEFLPLPLVRSHIPRAGGIGKYFEATDPNLEKVVDFPNFQKFLEYSRRQMSIFSVMWKDDSP